ncbi:uncharacterized protein LOC142555871 [Primulina tabacum]|uniref:uncharacterized protein LOC142555871 n=1 Tax=Primulina tabacum TaxID=48773 RepID=UPI003F59E711
MREVLMTTFPPGTFPVKVAIPVIPTVKVVITFTKFVQLQTIEHFYTPPSSPRQFSGGIRGEYFSSWLSGSRSRQQASEGEHMIDPFAIPSGYSWSSFDEKKKKMKKSKSSRRTK